MPTYSLYNISSLGFSVNDVRKFIKCPDSFFSNNIEGLLTKEESLDQANIERLKNSSMC